MQKTPTMPSHKPTDSTALHSSIIAQLLDASAVHDEWRPLLSQALATLDADYLGSLLVDTNWLPGPSQLLAAFRRNRQDCRFILFGESPYPRRESANGIAFHDAAVDSLWSDKGLSKAVNRATSLRNIIKTALLAQGLITEDNNGRIAQSEIAKLNRDHLIESLPELFDNLHARGFLLCNATPVLHPERKPAREAKLWSGFASALLSQIDACDGLNPTLLLWGKIAAQIGDSAAAQAFPQLRAEHPYNLSFIHNPLMLDLFAELQLLTKREPL